MNFCVECAKLEHVFIFTPPPPHTPYPLARNLGVSCQLENSVQCSRGSSNHLAGERWETHVTWDFQKSNSPNHSLPLWLSLSAPISRSSRLNPLSLALPAYYKRPFLFSLFIISALLMHGDEAISCGDGWAGKPCWAEGLQRGGGRGVIAPEGRRIAPAPASHWAPTGSGHWTGPGPALTAHSGNSC